MKDGENEGEEKGKGWRRRGVGGSGGCFGRSCCRERKVVPANWRLIWGLAVRRARTSCYLGGVSGSWASFISDKRRGSLNSLMTNHCPPPRQPPHRPSTPSHLPSLCLWQIAAAALLSFCSPSDSMTRIRCLVLFGCCFSFTSVAIWAFTPCGVQVVDFVIWVSKILYVLVGEKSFAHCH